MPVTVKLRSVPGIYSVARLAANAPIPSWFNGPGFSAAIRADDELTLVCLQERVPSDIEAEPDWRCFRSVGPVPFNATGIVRSLIEPLSSQGIGVFVVCTFDGEHVLVSASEWEKSRTLLEQGGHVFETCAGLRRKIPDFRYEIASAEKTGKMLAQNCVAEVAYLPGIFATATSSLRSACSKADHQIPTPIRSPDEASLQ